MALNKVIAIFFIFLMIGSSIAYAIISSFRTQEDEEIKVPTQKIIAYELSDKQRQVLLSAGYTLIEYEFPNACLDCASNKQRLEIIAQQSDGQIYLQELIGSQTEQIIITSFRGQEILKDDFTVDDIDTTICEMLAQKPLWCISAELIT